MWKKKRSKYFPYRIPVFSSLFIGVWWLVAFWFSFPTTTLWQALPSPPHTSSWCHPWLTKALHGDPYCMAQLLVQWDREAQQLVKKGVPSIERLTPEKIFQAHKWVLETTLSRPDCRLLPQNIVAASIALSLVPAESIVALPQGIREEKYPLEREKIEAIPLDITPFSNEDLFRRHPTAAFVSSYSDPNTIASWQQKGVPLYRLPDITNGEDLQQCIRGISHVAGAPAQGELLALFVEAALIAIDNQIRHLLHRTDFSCSPLFVSQGAPLEAPTCKTMFGHLLYRMHKLLPLRNESFLQEDRWSVPLTYEALREINPDALIVATTEDTLLIPRSMEATTAFQNHALICIDPSIQNFPSPYIVLAYYDLYKALEILEEPWKEIV